MWISQAQRARIREQDALALTAEAGRAKDRFNAVTDALAALSVDTRGTAILRRIGIPRIALGRSRVPENGNAEGLAVLEGVVLAGVVARLLSDGEMTRWLSCHHPKELAALHEVRSQGHWAFRGGGHNW